MWRLVVVLLAIAAWGAWVNALELRAVGHTHPQLLALVAVMLILAWVARPRPAR